MLRGTQRTLTGCPTAGAQVLAKVSLILWHPYHSGPALHCRVPSRSESCYLSKSDKAFFVVVGCDLCDLAFCELLSCLGEHSTRYPGGRARPLRRADDVKERRRSYVNGSTVSTSGSTAMAPTKIQTAKFVAAWKAAVRTSAQRQLESDQRRDFRHVRLHEKSVGGEHGYGLNTQTLRAPRQVIP